MIFEFPQDLVLPSQQLGAKIIALAVVHERLFFGGSIILQLFQGQPIFACKAERKSVRPRGPYIAAGCDRQYRPTHGESRSGRHAQAILQCRDGPACRSIPDRKSLPDMGRMLDFVSECNCEILKGNPAFPVCGGQKLVGPEPELARPLRRPLTAPRATGRSSSVDRRPTPRSRPCIPRESPAASPAGRSMPLRGCRHRRRHCPNLSIGRWLNPYPSKVAHKEVAFVTNATCGIRPRILTRRVQPSRAKGTAYVFTNG